MADQLGTKVAEREENRYAKTFMRRHVRNELLRKERANIPNDYSTQMLDSVKLRKPKSGSGKNQKKKLKMSGTEKKKFKVYDIKPEHQKYEMYEVLHEMWLDYINDLIDFSRFDPGSKTVQFKVLKADFHGAILRVGKSKTPSLVGTEGILLQEMRNVFKIITKEDRVKTIPKRKTTFEIDVEGHRITLYGDSIMMRSADRSHKKVKLNEPRMCFDL